VADPGIGWRILLTAELAEVPDAGVVLDRLSDLYTRQRWAGTAEVRQDDDAAALRARLVEGTHPVVVGLAGRTLIVSAHHSSVDGLGLLAVLSEVIGRPVASRVRGVADRPVRSGLARTTVRRAAEAAFRAPAGIDSPSAAGGGGDVFAELTVPGAPRTSALVHAAAQGVVRHNTSAGRRTRHLAVAVGAGRPDSDEDRIADRSALLRLTDLEDLSLAEIEDAVASAPLETPPTAGRRAGARALRGGMRLLSRRLGSTVLVSHLGDVRAEALTGLAFHPVTAGGSGVSLGAVTLSERTTLTLRARAARWDAPGLQQLLGTIAEELV
jgi:hypothetical protein